MTTLDDILDIKEAANACHFLHGMAESYKVRRLRELVTENESPYIPVGKKMFFRPEHINELAKIIEWRSNSKKSKALPTGISGAQFKESPSIDPLELRTKYLPKKKD